MTPNAIRTPGRDPARLPWHEVGKVAHYWLEVSVMGGGMEEKEAPAYGDGWLPSGERL